MSDIVSAELKRVLQAGMSQDSQVDAFIAFLDSMATALNGDVIMEIVPTTATRLPTAAAFTRDVVITFKDAAGNVHKWLTETFSGALSIGDTSTAGTASIVSTDLVVVAGVATVTVSGDAAAWLDTETNTLTIANVTPQNLAKAVTGGTSVETITA